MTIGKFIEQLKELVPDMNEEIGLICFGDGKSPADSVLVQDVAFKGKIRKLILLGDQAYLEKSLSDYYLNDYLGDEA